MAGVEGERVEDGERVGVGDWERDGRALGQEAGDEPGVAREEQSGRGRMLHLPKMKMKKISKFMGRCHTFFFWSAEPHPVMLIFS